MKINLSKMNREKLQIKVEECDQDELNEVSNIAIKHEIFDSEFDIEQSPNEEVSSDENERNDSNAINYDNPVIANGIA